MWRFVLIFLTLFTSLFGEEEEIKKRILVSKIDKDSYRMKIFFNFENPYDKLKKFLQKGANDFSITLSIPDRFKIFRLKTAIYYKASPSIEERVSSISIMANNNFVKQFQLIGGQKSENIVKSIIPVEYLVKGYNSIGVHIYQKGFKEEKGSTLGGGNPIRKAKPTKSGGKKLVIKKIQESKNSSPPIPAPVLSPKTGIGTTVSAEIWTQINLDKSYIEFDFKLKPFKEALSSIYTFMFDNKNIYKDNINFVFPKVPTEEDLTNYSIVANAIGMILGFGYINFHVSTSIRNDMNNIIIGKWSKLQQSLKKYIDTDEVDIDNRVGTLSIYRNKQNITKGILVISGDSQKEIKKAIFKLFDPSLKIYNKQVLSVISYGDIEKAPPYSAPGFVRPGERIYFKDLGLEPLTFVGDGVFRVSYNFRLYPSFRSRPETDFVKMRLKYFSSDASKMSKTFNISINDIFVYQYIDKELYNSLRETYRDTGEFIFSSNLLDGGGDFSLDIEISTNLKDPLAQPSDIRLTLKDDSYVIFPKGASYIELPELKYISDFAFPFSIYPDLQDTGIVITDFNSKTIASAMFIASILGMNIKYPGYFLKTTYDINSVSSRNLIIVGRQIDNYDIVYKNAPIQILRDSIIRRIYNEDLNRTLEYREKVDLSNFLIVQTYKSPFNPKKIVFEVTANSPTTLYKGVHKGLTTQNTWNFKGDTWLYNIKTKKGYPYQFQKKYIVKDILDNENIEEPVYIEEI